jgi:putative transposase
MRYRRIHQPGGTYFFTLIAHGRKPLFADLQTIARYRRAVATVQAKRPFTLEAEVILHDHIHALWTLPEGDADYPTRWRLIKSAFTKSQNETTQPSISRQSKGERAVWQRRYWEHTIRDEPDFQTHLDYIHFNPVQHGYVTALAIGRIRRFSNGSTVAATTLGGVPTIYRHFPIGPKIGSSLFQVGSRRSSFPAMR